MRENKQRGEYLYYLLSLLTGLLISFMVLFNGGLTTQYGVYTATIIIHVAGLILIAVLTLIKREKPFLKRHIWFLYLGGAIGVFTTVFNNLAFGRISVSAILALGLLGQTVTGLFIDQFGLLGMRKHPVFKSKLTGLILIMGGIAAMIDNFEVVAVVVSFAAGINIVVSRTLNARLANLTSVSVSTFYNYLVGLVVSIPIFLLLGRGEPDFIGLVMTPRPHIYLGGILGVCIVFISNIIVVKISAFYLTLLVFIGQVFSGVIIDMVISQALSLRILLGGILVAAGLCINLIIDNSSFAVAKLDRDQGSGTSGQ